MKILASKHEQTKPRKKYARSKPPSPPAPAPHPADKKERKKAQNRTAAFRYREKKKSELDLAEEELEGLANKNVLLREKLSETLQLLLCQVQLALLLLPVPEGGSSVLSLRPLFLVSWIGSRSGRRRRFTPGVFFPWFSLLMFAGEDLHLTLTDRSRRWRPLWI